MILANPPSYLTAAQFQAQANDYDLSSYTSTQIQDILNRATGKADAIMRRSLLATERVVRVYGDGSNKIELNAHPLIYVKKIEIVVPGSNGPIIPVDQVLIDFTSGSLLEYTPMYYNGAGYFARFPYGVPIDITVGTGYGYAVASPSITTADANGTNGLAPGTYNLAVSSKTMWGESAPIVRQVSTSTGNIAVTIAPEIGAYLYRAYLSPAANNTTLGASTLVGATTFTVASAGTYAVGQTVVIDTGTNAEATTITAISGTTFTTAPLVNAHAMGVPVIAQPMLVGESPFTAYGLAAMTITVTSLNPPSGVYADSLPLTDTSAAVLPYAVIEATRILALSILYEQNNLANRGVYMTRTNRKEVSWKSTEGTSGKGTPLMEVQATELLKPYRLAALF